MKILVTGGGGFLGGAICKRLLARGDRARSLSRGHYPALEAMGVECVRGDIADAEAVHQAAKGCDAVFHVAAKAGIWGDYEEYKKANVEGTWNVLEACRRRGIGKLVYTSSPSVVFDGRDMAGIDESAPYPRHFEAHYPRTKAEAERLALGAAGASLGVVALRPHLIWGPGDNHLVPRILSRARAGALRRITGDTKLVDSVYIDNAAEAHILALDRLQPGAKISGRAYFITNGEPMPIWDLINRILEAAGEGPVVRSVSPKVAYAAGAVLETAYRLVGKKSEPRMTRFLAKQLSTTHWFDISAARRDLRYEPKVSVAEGLQRLAESLSAA